MKGLPLKRRLFVEHIIRVRTPHFSPSPDERARFDVMSLAELRALDPALITIGAHTMSHPILTGLPPEEAKREIEGSRKVLESWLSRPVGYFCYPNGLYDDVSERYVRRAYRAAVTTAPEVVPAGGDPFRLPRLCAVPDVTELAWRVSAV
jgi:peptidoglycan/xylan/chitin deacetylase (PgdA/CDA1 family)